MSEHAVIYTITNGVAVLKLNRPTKRNALNLEARSALWEAVDNAATDTQVKVLVITGSGEHFCAGGDISQMRPGELDAEAGRDRITPFTKGAQRLLELPKPVVVAVDGCAYGAGFSLALAADFVVATERARFCLSFLRLGLVPDACALFTLPRVVGWSRAKDLLYSTREIRGKQALEYGIVNELVKSDCLHSRALEIAEAMTNLPRTMFGVVKSAMLRSMSTDLGTMVDIETSGQAIAYSTEYHEIATNRIRASEGPLFVWPPLDSAKSQG